MVAKILSDQKLDPTIINGGVINSFKSNARLGKGDWAILEADKSDMEVFETTHQLFYCY